MFKIQLTRSGAFVPYAAFENLQEGLRAVINQFTLRFRTITGAYESISRSQLQYEKKRIIVPRFGARLLLNNKKKFRLKDELILENLISAGQPTPFTWRGTLTHNQEVVIAHLMNNVYNDEARATGLAGCVLNLEAGQGKTYVAARLISLLQTKTCYVLHSSATLEQTRQAFTNTLTDVSIGAYYTREKTDGDIVLIIINSALSDVFKFDDGREIPAIEFFRQFGLIIFDECHEYSGKWKAGVFRRAQSTCVLGLSATPDANTKGFDDVVMWELGPIVLANTLPDYRRADINFTAQVTRIRYYGPPEYTKTIINEVLGVVNAVATMNMIACDPYRIRVILDAIHACLAGGLNVFVFADRKEYLEIIRQLFIGELRLRSNNTMNDIDASDVLFDERDYQRIVGGASEDEFKQAEVKSRVIFTTYQYMGTGKSIIKMNALIFATPRKTKLKQYYNRIFRLGSDAAIRREIYIISDMKTTFGKHWTHHNKYISEMGYAVANREVKAETLTPVVLPRSYNSLAELVPNSLTELVPNSLAESLAESSAE